MSLGSLLPLLSQQYELNNTMSGGLISAHQTGNLIAGFIASILPVYLGRKKAILFLCSFVIVGFAIMMYTGNPVLLILGFLFTGLSRGSISNFNNTIVNEVSGSNPTALNLLHSIFAVGALLAPFLIIASTSIGGEGGWRIATSVIIILLIISLILFSRMNIDESGGKKKKLHSYGFIKNYHFWVGASIILFYLCIESAVSGWLVKYFVDAEIMNIQFAQLLNSLLWLVILLGRLITAFSSQRLPKEFILVTASIGAVIFYILLLSSQSIGLITFSIMGLGLSMSGIYPTTVATIGETIKNYPMAMGVLLMIGGVGAILMPIITGAIADRFGILAGMSSIIVAISLLVVCIIANLIHVTKSKKQTKVV